MVSMDRFGCVNAKNTGVRIFAVGLCAVALLMMSTGQAAADDWAVESGDERQQRIIERYQEMLEENPVEGMALQRLLGHVGRGAGLDRLIAEYERRLEARPEARNLMLVLGHLLKARGDHEAAFEQYDRAVELDRNDSLGWLSRGAVRLLMGERRQAMEDFEEALSRERNTERRREILRELGELSFSEREFERGIEFFERLVGEAPRDQFLRMEYVSILVQYRQLEEALEQYDALERIVSGDPRQRATLLRDRADVYEMMGDWEAALQTYEDVKGLVRSDSWVAREVRDRIVEVYRQMGRLDDFLSDYGTRWGRGDTEQRMAVADVHAEIGKLEEALELYRALARRSPRSVEPRQKIIRVLERLGRDDELDGAYRDLMRAAPDEPQYGYDLAQYYMQLGDREAAQGVLEEMERRFSRQSYVLLGLADHYARWNFVEQARELYETVLARETDDDAVLIDVGDFYFDRGDRRRALEVWEKLPQSQLGQTEGSRRMAEVLVERGVLTEGIAAFERLIEESPEDERLLRAMARALERARQWDDALERWQQLLDVTEDSTRKREARSRIVELHERSQRLRARMRDWSRKFEDGEAEEAVEAGFFLVEAHLRLAELDEAREILQALDEQYELTHQEQTSLFLALERIHVRAEDYDEAIAVLERLAAHDPDMRAEALERKTGHSLAARDGERAVEFASRATTANPNDAAAQERLGDVYREVGDLEAALSHYRTATDIDPRAHDAYLKLGQVLMELGREAEAREVLMKVILEARESQLVRDAGAKMLVEADAQGRLDALEVQWTPLMFRMPVQEAHARLVFDLYDLLVGPLLMTMYHGSMDDRRGARQRLYELGGRAAPLLVEQLQRDSTAARMRALRMIAEMEVDLAAPQVARLITSDDEHLRARAIATAARLGDDRFVEPLLEALHDGSGTVRHLAIWALGFQDDSRARSALRELADTDVEGTDSLLATLGLWGADDEESRRVVGQALERLVADPAGVDRHRAAVLLAVAATVVADGGGRAYRDTVQQLTRSSVGGVGRWSARLVGIYGDETASTELWKMALGSDPALRRRGELGLLEMAAESAAGERTWDEEVRHFDWSDGSFAPDSLLRDVGRRWTESTAAVPEQRWSDEVVAGLEAVLAQQGDAVDVEASLGRILEQVRQGQDSTWWDEDGMRRFAGRLLEAEPFDGVDASTAMTIRILAGEDDGIPDDLSSLTDRELMAVMDAITMTESDQAQQVGPLVFGEALQRSAPRVRRKALGSLVFMPSMAPLDQQLEAQIIEALQDGDRSIQLAAVRAAGQLRLSPALESLDSLETEAPPALRRAVRQTRRVLDEQ